LSWNNPARLQLLELAQCLERQAKELELQNHPAEKGGLVTDGRAGILDLLLTGFDFVERFGGVLCETII
jgi:hypothetical protein